jgi:gluconokinase
VPGARAVLVGIDIGTSAVKVLACTLAGGVLSSEARSYSHATPQAGYVEQDAETIYAAALGALHAVLEVLRARADDVTAIGFSSAMHGLLPVGARGEPIGPLVTWMDRRSAPVAERWRADGTANELYTRTGAPVHPMLPSCKLRWFAENDPSYIANAARFVSIKELIVFRWTGEWLIDWGMASGTGLFDFRAHDWSAAALDAARIGADKLSTLAPPSTLRRNLQPAIARELGLDARTAIVLASSDGALANLGVGAVTPGELALTLGTSGAIRVVVEQPVLDERGRTFCYAYDDRKYIVGGPTSSAGAVLDKIGEFLAPDLEPAQRFADAVRRAETSPPGARGVTVMPFLSGERAPYWLPELRGGIVGLDLSHSRDDILRAAIESVVFALASVYDVLRERIAPIERICLSGGLTRAPLVRQLVADVFAREAVLADQPEASAFGAAMMAGISAGSLPDDAAVAALLQPAHVHAPNPEMVERYAVILARYRKVVDANLPLYTS